MTAGVSMHFDSCNQTVRAGSIRIPDCIAPTTIYTLRGATYYGVYRSSGYPSWTVASRKDVTSALELSEESDGTVGGRTAAMERLLQRIKKMLPEFDVTIR